MAQFQALLGDDIMKELNKLYDKTPDIMGEMTKAGAEVVQQNIKQSVPLSQMASHVKLSKQYKTPTDGAWNTKVYFSGYLPFSGNRTSFTRSGGSGKKYTTTQGVPVDFLAMVYEYGRSGPPFPKKPFFRKAFKRDQVIKAMEKAQKKASGGLIE